MRLDLGTPISVTTALMRQLTGDVLKDITRTKWCQVYNLYAALRECLTRNYSRLIREYIEESYET